LFVDTFSELRTVERLSQRVASRDSDGVRKMKKWMLLSHEHNHTSNNVVERSLIKDLFFVSSY
jgi:hypothetical protein